MMNRDEEIALIQRCARLLQERRTEISDVEAFSPVERYLSADRYACEISAVFRRMPLMVAHGTELAGEGSYLARDWVDDFPLLLSRDEQGDVRAFANACRHRGARLVGDGAGCARRFTCPYHAWTYGLDGRLRAVPQKAEGFPSLDMSGVGLKELRAVEAFGFVWLTMDADGPSDMAAHLAGLGRDFDWMGTADHELFAQEVTDWNANWKIIVEGGLESYHFKVAHRDTIAPLFNDNLSVHDDFGPHTRSFLTKQTLMDIGTTPETDWNIRHLGNLLYTIYPSTMLLLQPDYFTVVQVMPLGPCRSRISLKTFVPRGAAQTEKGRAHWRRNHDLTIATLNEDFVIGEQIQRGIGSGANDRFRFGRFEQELHRFHDTTDALLA